jgi:tetratricopeptide (TPR) repeat protein
VPEKSEEEKNIEVHEKKSRVGTRIAPPTESMAKDERAKSAIEELLSAGPSDSLGEDEYEAPAEGVLQDPAEKERQELEKRRRDLNMRPLDKELSGGRKSMDDRHFKDVIEIDKSLGVEPTGTAQEAPSYTKSVILLKQLFKERQYEEALIVLQELMQFYPLSPQLLMMKGTLHQRLQQIDLALAAYEKAFDIEPSKRLKAQIDYLKRRAWEREKLRERATGVVIPLGVQETRSMPSKSSETKGLKKVKPQGVPNK